MFRIFNLKWKMDCRFTLGLKLFHVSLADVVLKKAEPVDVRPLVLQPKSQVTFIFPTAAFLVQLILPFVCSTVNLRKILAVLHDPDKHTLKA